MINANILINNYYMRKCGIQIEKVLINEDGKLRTYLKIKIQFGFEKYLDLIIFEMENVSQNFRISQHKLKIEIGRYMYTKPFTPAYLGLCGNCNLIRSYNKRPMGLNALT